LAESSVLFGALKPLDTLNLKVEFLSTLYDNPKLPEMPL
jgi:hypothetical protein